MSYISKPIPFSQLKKGDKFVLMEGPRFVMEKLDEKNYRPVPLGPTTSIDPKDEVRLYVSEHS